MTSSPFPYQNHSPRTPEQSYEYQPEVNNLDRWVTNMHNLALAKMRLKLGSPQGGAEIKERHRVASELVRNLFEQIKRSQEVAGSVIRGSFDSSPASHFDQLPSPPGRNMPNDVLTEPSYSKETLQKFAEFHLEFYGNRFCALRDHVSGKPVEPLSEDYLHSLGSPD